MIEETEAKQEEATETETETTETETETAVESGTPNTPKETPMLQKELDENGQEIEREIEQPEKAKQIDLQKEIKRTIKKDKETRYIAKALQNAGLAMMQFLFGDHIYEASEKDRAQENQNEIVQENARQKVDPAMVRMMDQGRGR